MKNELWGAGPWDDEPDRVQWTDEATGLPCLARRARLGIWCGYVAVPPEHVLFGRGYDDPEVDVHGGLTYAAVCDGEPEIGICHVAAPGEPDHVWWFGFDCGHYPDFCPASDTSLRLFGEPGLADRLSSRQEYRTLAFVQQECANLATQLAAITTTED